MNIFAMLRRLVESKSGKLAREVSKPDTLLASIDDSLNDMSGEYLAISESLEEMRKTLGKLEDDQAYARTMLTRIFERQSELLESVGRVEDNFTLSNADDGDDRSPIEEMLADVLRQQRDIIARISRIEDAMDAVALADPAPEQMSNELLLAEVREEFDELRHHVDVSIRAIRGSAD